jgi:hypothetical protein
VRDDVGAAKADVEASEAVEDLRANDRDDLGGLAHAPMGLTIATEPPAITESPAIPTFPTLAPPGSCPYLQLDGVRQASCLALTPVIALAPRQVELVCLGAAHLDCPRFVRAGYEDVPPIEASELTGLPRNDGVEDAERAVLDVPPPSASVEVPSARLGGTVGSLRTTPQARRSRRPRPATLAATGTLAGAVALAIGFAAVRGGIDLSFGGAPAGSVAAATGVPWAATSVSSMTGADASGPAGASAHPSPGVPSALSSVPPGSPASPSPAASPDRLALLTPCPDLPDCYQYRIRRHDNLRGIASFFGVPYQTVLDLNPQIENPSLIHVGQVIILPPPGP